MPSSALHPPSAATSPLRIELQQVYDMRFRWVLLGPHGSLAASPLFLRKAACLRAVRALQRDCNATVDDCTLTAPLEAL